MQCPKCGWQNPDDAIKCNNCFTELVPTTPQQPEPTQQMPQPPQQPYPQQPQPPYGQQPYAQQQPYGQPQQQPYGQGWTVPDYMVWSIVVTVVSVLCCGCPLLPVAFGIVAIVKSSNANGKKAIGDILGAQRDANAAKTWLYWAVGLDIVGFIINVLGFIFFFANRGSQVQQYWH